VGYSASKKSHAISLVQRLGTRATQVDVLGVALEALVASDAVSTHGLLTLVALLIVGWHLVSGDGLFAVDTLLGLFLYTQGY
jgi:hypothetical protein